MSALKQRVLGVGSDEMTQFAEHVCHADGTENTTVVNLNSPVDSSHPGSDCDCAILFDIVATSQSRSCMEQLELALRRMPEARVFLVSDAAAHLGTEKFLKAEKRLLEHLRGFTSGIVVLRLSRGKSSSRNNSRGDMFKRLLSVIQTECRRPRRSRTRTLTLLGFGESKSHASRNGHVPKRSDRWGTLTPQSVEELLALYNPYNYEQIQLAGYNTGVQHFGWTFPEKTVVKTIETGKRIRLVGDQFQVDAGMTLKRAIQFLNERGKEFLVIPNYSYISMGTCFFVPIHGSGSEVSNLGDTIEKAVLYLPDEDRLRVVRRGDEAFSRYLYCPDSKALVLRLTFRVRDKTRYFMTESTVLDSTPTDIVRELNDPQASNVEIRKSHAADRSVTIRKYYEQEDGGDVQSGDLMELPKDSLGRVWDRLEETPVVSTLFHHFVKRYGYHVELFLNEQEFDRFWQSHDRLPLRKIQLRRMKRDGMLHSPCRDSDRISADIFMKRVDKDEFLDYVEHHIPEVRFNPGKHSK